MTPEITDTPAPDQTIAQTAAQPAPTAAATAPKKSKALPLIVLMIFAGLIVAGLVYYFTVYRYFESTDNAYVKAEVTWVMPRVPGEVVALNVKANQQVKAGEVLMKLDDRDTQARYQQAQAIVSLKSASLDVQAQNVRAQEAAVAEAQAGLRAAQAEVSRIQKDYQRYQSLLKDGVTTRQRVEAVQSQYLNAQAQVERANAAISAAQAQLSAVRASREQMLADVKSAEANVSLVGVDSTSATVTAPVAGTIGSLGVRLGSRVTPQTRLLAIVPLQTAYVEANFKETQIGKMRAGQKVELEFDAYPGKVFHGHIDSFAPASGAEFSLMPPDNATGNFNKVVQRLPVKILIDDLQDRQSLRPGLSVSAKVDLRS